MHSQIKSRKLNNIFILFVCLWIDQTKSKSARRPKQTNFTQTTLIKSKQIVTKSNQPKANQLVLA